MRHLILVIALLCFGSLAESAEITVNAPDAYHRIFVDIVGEITPNDDQTFERKVATLQAHYQAQNPPYLSQDPGQNPSADPGLNPKGAIGPVSDYDKVIVTLSGPGGVALTAMKIGERIHTNGWATYVPSGTVCASSCAIIWLAGMPRTIEGAPGVIIGFHAVYDAQTQRESGAANAVLGYYLTLWGLNDRGIECVTITPPNEMGWLTGPNGQGCGITWEVLTPARDVPLQLSLNPPPSTATPQRQATESKYLSCSPTLSQTLTNPTQLQVLKLGSGSFRKIAIRRLNTSMLGTIHLKATPTSVPNNMWTGASKSLT